MTGEREAEVVREPKGMSRQQFLRIGGCPHCWPEDRSSTDTEDADVPYRPLSERLERIGADKDAVEFARRWEPVR